MVRLVATKAPPAIVRYIFSPAAWPNLQSCRYKRSAAILSQFVHAPIPLQIFLPAAAALRSSTAVRVLRESSPDARELRRAHDPGQTKPSVAQTGVLAGALPIGRTRTRLLQNRILRVALPWRVRDGIASKYRRGPGANTAWGLLRAGSCSRQRVT